MAYRPALAVCHATQSAIDAAVQRQSGALVAGTIHGLGELCAISCVHYLFPLERGTGADGRVVERVA